MSSTLHRLPLFGGSINSNLTFIFDLLFFMEDKSFEETRASFFCLKSNTTFFDCK